ncbi:molybdenum cofactor biosynthesis protein MoaE [Alteriqipengyuania lutimaris]|uniref:Molybdopterin synthase catalytic subunit n=1 Tax=Alteriqipengyuania lutimaris TaxID=1538146 RepID=A0A395LQB0_9SPHN|nr:molybdenum cofactor biosynthesis protein MoaE [Alteriqipengyuania lutimaris]MBB3033187.1 molybdopterin synthase catalytic subunit [Alteriqipengyuania lutimaris]RDS77764.1 molybdenum cofactor biosynthesis protein MoaE [Alteriqipengyuania lutimaris]
MARLTLDTPADVRLLDSGLSVGEALAAFNAAYPQAGGIATFLGKVRPEEDGDPADRVHVLELSHYEPLTLPGMRDLAGQAMERWPLDGVLAWHRVGVMHPGEAIVLVAAAARHRRDAFHAVDFLMDYLKSAAWLWKREKRGPRGEGAWHWIEPRAQDFADRNRWE